MSKIENIKNHFKNNKVTYIACGVTAVVVAGVTYYVTRNGSAVKAVAATAEITAEKVLNNAPTMINNDCINPIMNVINFVEDSTPSKQIALLDESGGVIAAWKSISEAARQTGLDRAAISRNVNNLVDNVKGNKFALVNELADAAA